MILKNGRTNVKYWTVKQGEEHRDKYAKGLYNKNGNLNSGHSWNKSFNGMVIKSIAKEIFRTTKLSPQLSAAVVTDDISECKPGIKDITKDVESMSAEELKTKIKNHDSTVDKEPEPAPEAPKSNDAF